MRSKRNRFATDGEKPASSDYNRFIRSNFKNFQDHFKLRHTAAVFHELGKVWKQLGQAEKMVYRDEVFPRDRIPDNCSAHTLFLDSRKVERRSAGNAGRAREEAEDGDVPEVKRRRRRRRTVQVQPENQEAMNESPSPPEEEDEVESVERTEIFTEEFLELSRNREQIRCQLKRELAAEIERRDRIQMFLSNTLPVQSDLKRDIAMTRVWVDNVATWHKRLEAKLIAFCRKNKIVPDSVIEDLGFVRLVDYLANNQQNIPDLKKIFRALLTCSNDIA